MTNLSGYCLFKMNYLKHTESFLPKPYRIQVFSSDSDKYLKLCFHSNFPCEWCLSSDFTWKFWKIPVKRKDTKIHDKLFFSGMTIEKDCNDFIMFLKLDKILLLFWRFPQFSNIRFEFLQTTRPNSRTWRLQILNSCYDYPLSLLRFDTQMV